MSQSEVIICRDLSGKEYNVQRKDLIIRPSVYGVVVQDKQVLLVPQWDGYDFPGGGIEQGESIEEALVREYKEETGFDIEQGDLITVYDNFYFSRINKLPFQSILIYFTCRIVSGELSTDGFDEHEQHYARQAEWIDLRETDKIKFSNSLELRQATNSKSVIDRAVSLLK